jgi:hypothetical protein
MDPTIQQVKELLESIDPGIEVVECLPSPCLTTAATNTFDLVRKPLQPNNPDIVSTTDCEPT